MKNLLPRLYQERFLLWTVLGWFSWLGKPFAGASAATKDDSFDLPTMRHRLFPAASTEIYEQEPLCLGIVRPESLKVEISGPKDGGDEFRVMADAAIQRFQDSLRKSVPEFAEDYPKDTTSPRHQLERIEIHLLSSNTQLVPGVKENYEIVMDDQADFVAVAATTIFGALHALQSIGQLLEFGWLEGSDDGSIQTTVLVTHGLPLMIVDEPAFSYRGLMIDTARHYLPMDLILHNLDAMAMNKLNVLHWHLTDSQSFPWQSSTYPELAANGAFHPKRIYTSQDIQMVIREARLRGIRVIPEVDMPGHTDSIGKARPEFMSHCPDPQAPLDPTNPQTLKFVQDIYQDLTNLFDDPYIHVGGDEVPMDCWNQSQPIQQWMQKHNMTQPIELYEYFETRLLQMLDTSNKIPIVWQEVFDLNLTTSNDTVVDVWKNWGDSLMKNTTEAALNASHPVIVSACWYLDHLGDTWEKFYSCNITNVTTNHPELLLGGHASMWGEHVDASNFISRIWPRASSMAERLWTGNVYHHGAASTIAERMPKFRCRLVQQGFSAGPTGPGDCPTDVPYQPLAQRLPYSRKQDDDVGKEDKKEALLPRNIRGIISETKEIVGTFE